MPACPVRRRVLYMILLAKSWGIELELDAPAGGVIQLSYGESLEPQLYDTFILRKGAKSAEALWPPSFPFPSGYGAGDAGRADDIALRRRIRPLSV